MLTNIEFEWPEKWQRFRLELFGLLGAFPAQVADQFPWWVMPLQGTDAQAGDAAVQLYVERAMCVARSDYSTLVYPEYRWLPGLRRLSRIYNADLASDGELKSARDGFALLQHFQEHRDRRARNVIWRDGERRQFLLDLQAAVTRIRARDRNRVWKRVSQRRVAAEMDIHRDTLAWNANRFQVDLDKELSPRANNQPE